ncbi:hypothetical protein ACVXG7_11980 [Enterobacter hormaechei]
MTTPLNPSKTAQSASRQNSRRTGKNHPRNLFIWRSNLLGSSGKGHEYMLKYLLGTENGIQGKILQAGRREARRS